MPGLPLLFEEASFPEGGRCQGAASPSASGLVRVRGAGGLLFWGLIQKKRKGCVGEAGGAPGPAPDSEVRSI